MPEAKRAEFLFGSVDKSGPAVPLAFRFGSLDKANQITLGYNGSSQLVTLTHSNGGQLLIDYNANGRISTVTDSTMRWPYSAEQSCPGLISPSSL